MTQIITVIRGDGIGPEIMQATLHVLDAMDVGLSYEFADAGLVALEKTGELLPAATLESIRRNRIALKSPLTTPVGGGFRSEEHTSELQSLMRISYAVFCLKKKIKTAKRQ